MVNLNVCNVTINAILAIDNLIIASHVILWEICLKIVSVLMAIMKILVLKNVNNVHLIVKPVKMKLNVFY